MAYLVNSSLEDKYVANRALLLGDIEPLQAFLQKQSSLAQFSSGRRIPGELVPTRARIQKMGARFYDYNNFQIAAGVSLRFKDLVESIEPGVHQFFPIELLRQDSVTPYGEPFWLLNVTTRVDAISLVNSAMYQRGEDGQFGPIDPDGRFTGYAHYVLKSPPPPAKCRITVFKDRISGRALWYDFRYITSQFCSEAMMAGIRELEIEGLTIGSVVKHVDEI